MTVWAGLLARVIAFGLRFVPRALEYIKTILASSLHLQWADQKNMRWYYEIILSGHYKLNVSVALLRRNPWPERKVDSSSAEDYSDGES
jgi:hypothetical protein